ncbi:hypothetical protein Lalb_Chr01g0003571 [Lupinus albus]|uniref:Uncharacterized protein n=1 Tax=Lupinus albus TaxID=3870 RepID=A0A6A4R516_LUPAL|nr:hypothetical protein Lalb_Chr01g0003571 [Lupinus albus]
MPIFLQLQPLLENALLLNCLHLLIMLPSNFALPLHLCSVVIVEGDPCPGTKLNEEEAKVGQPAAETTISKNQSGNVSFRENSSGVEGPESASIGKKSHEVNGNVKRKHVEVVGEEQYPNKASKNDQGNRQSSQKNSLGSFKKPNGDKLDWNILRPSKCQTE